jgi:WD40 repeat protein
VFQTFNTHTDSVVSIVSHPDGKHLAYVGADQQVKVWDLTTRQEVIIGPCDVLRKFGTAHAVAFSPAGRQLAAGSDGVVSVWDWKSSVLTVAGSPAFWSTFSLFSGRRRPLGGVGIKSRFFRFAQESMVVCRYDDLPSARLAASQLVRLALPGQLRRPG